jgi:hypothetical protein
MAKQAANSNDNEKKADQELLARTLEQVRDMLHDVEQLLEQSHTDLKLQGSLPEHFRTGSLARRNDRPASDQ